MTQVAFLGLGAMGSRMAMNILAAGHGLTVYNRSPARAASLRERGADAANTPRAAVAGADIVISMVADDTAARAIWLDPSKGALAALGAEAIAIECSTLSIAGVETLQHTFAAVGRAFLAAPVLGSLPQAEARALIVLAGGARELRERAQPALSAIAARVVSLATPQQAAALKLAINAMFSTQVAVFSELLGMLRRAGLEPSTVLAAITDLPTTSPALASAATLLIKGDDAPRYPIRMVEKDLRYLIEAAQERPPVVGAVADSFRHAMAQDLGGCNISAIGRLIL
jgi:3-hydroxyisobutyrate dehydrogenase